MRRLRVLLAANDGFSAGHVARAVALAHALTRTAAQRKIGVEALLVTTSEATGLYADAPLAVVRLPSPRNAHRAFVSDVDRRRLVRSLVDTAAESFAPDLVVIDTFPLGPHGELEGLLRGPAKRALVRRHVRADRAADETLLRGVERFDLVVLADDPGPIDPPREARRSVRVPPITIAEPEGALLRGEARRALGIPPDARAILVVAGGGGDLASNEAARRIAQHLVEVDPHARVVVAAGPLHERRAPGEAHRVETVSVAPLQRYLCAFDRAFSAAGYNSAHELAKAGVPTALFPEPRPFDDQEARAKRFARAGLAFVLDRIEESAIAQALAWTRSAPRDAIPTGGADRAAEALLSLVTGAAP